MFASKQVSYSGDDEDAESRRPLNLSSSLVDSISSLDTSQLSSVLSQCFMFLPPANQSSLLETLALGLSVPDSHALMKHIFAHLLARPEQARPEQLLPSPTSFIDQLLSLVFKKHSIFDGPDDSATTLLSAMLQLKRSG